MAHVNEVDLPPGLACLKNLDTLLRCPICFDHINIAMMSQCSHNFCSLCIRKFLSYKLQCPVCNLPMTEQDLRTNRILDDLVKGFQDARQRLSQVQFETPPISPKTPSSAVKRKAPPPQPLAPQALPQAKLRSQKKDCSVLSHFFQKQSTTKTNATAAAVATAEMADQPGPVSTRSAGREALPPRGKRARTSGPRSLAVTVKQEPSGEQEVSPQVGREQAVHHPSSSSAPSLPAVQVKMEKTEDFDHSPPSTSLEMTPVLKVECPVCDVPVSQQHINKHLDTCLRSEEKKEALRSSGRRKPMAKVVYTLLSLVELRRRLRECHLSTQGSRDQLVKRHQEFVLVYNAECDAQQPRSAEVIAKEVETNEKMRTQLEKKSKTNTMVFRKNQTEEEIEALHSDYRKQHSSEFSRLIAQVKGRMEKSKRERQVKQEKEETSVADMTADENASSSQQAPSPAHDKADPARRSPPPKTTRRSPSPTPSDVSISSSISDVFS